MITVECGTNTLNTHFVEFTMIDSAWISACSDIWRSGEPREWRKFGLLYCRCSTCDIAPFGGYKDLFLFPDTSIDCLRDAVSNEYVLRSMPPQATMSWIFTPKCHIFFLASWFWESINVWCWDLPHLWLVDQNFTTTCRLTSGTEKLSNPKRALSHSLLKNPCSLVPYRQILLIKI